MIAPVYQTKHPTPAVQDAMKEAMIRLAMREGYLDSKGHPQPSDGVRYADNIMAIVQMVADDGMVEWRDHTQQAGLIAKSLGYESTSNCMAAIREAVKHDLLSAKAAGQLTMTSYGMEQLIRWEGREDENTT